jgi:hypothetical protein
MAEREVKIRLTAADVGASATINNVSRAVDSLAGKGEAAGGGGLKSVLADLKDSFGKSSALGSILQLARGAGAIGGIGLAAKYFANIASEVRNAAEGGTSLGKAFVESIPLIGKLVHGAEDFRDVLSGAASRAGELKRHMEDVAALRAAQKTAFDESTLTSIINAGQLAALKGGVFAPNQEQLATLQARQQLDADNAAIAKKEAELQALQDAARKARQSSTFYTPDPDATAKEAKLVDDISRAKAEAQNRYNQAVREGHEADVKAARQAEDDKRKSIEETLRKRREMEQEEIRQRIDQQKRWQDELDEEDRRRADASRRKMQEDLEHLRDAQNAVEGAYEQRTRNREAASNVQFGAAQISRFGDNGAQIQRESIRSDYARAQAADAKTTADATKKLNDQMDVLIRILRGQSGSTSTVVLN